MNKALCAAVALIALCGVQAYSQELPADKQEGIRRAIEPSLVRVEISIQHDKGELPRSMTWGERCPNCGEVHSNAAEDFVKEERPIEASGFVLSPTQVVTEDIQMHPRFIKSLHVRKGDQLIPAKIVRYASEHAAVILELEKALNGVEPLKFSPQKSGPYIAVNYKSLNAEWQLGLKPVPTAATFRENGQAFVAVPSSSLIVDRTGAPVGMSMREELPLNDSWKGSPLQWPGVAADEMRGRLAQLEQAASRGIVRVALSFRSPKSKPETQYRYRSFEQDDDETEREALGIVIEKNRVLVLADLKPKVTARLQRIQVHLPDGETISAKFNASLKHYGAFVADLEKPLSTELKFSGADIRSFRNRLMPLGDIKVHGEKRVAYFAHGRIASFKTGWRTHVYPEMAGDSEAIFLFNAENELVAVPLVHRDKSKTDRYSAPSPKLTAAAYVKAALEKLSENTDPANVPLSEDDENRLAWLGIELQALTKELARVNNVSDETRDGEVGALVTYVYPASPAAEAGIEPGFVLARLRTADEPAPLDVKLDDTTPYQAFPWERLDEVQDRFFDRIPTPWPSVENKFTRLLTDLGIGTEYTAEFFHDGQMVQKQFAVAVSPAHFNAAPRYKSDLLGLTVRNLTYEVRRYLQRSEDEPGVVISKVEPGSRASVSGIKPYELITHVNDQPVHNVQEFEQLVSQTGELSLALKRMATGRVVKIKAATEE